jgi:hypothetical protein
MSKFPTNHLLHHDYLVAKGAVPELLLHRNSILFFSDAL